MFSRLYVANGKLNISHRYPFSIKVPRSGWKSTMLEEECCRTCLNSWWLAITCGALSKYCIRTAKLYSFGLIYELLEIRSVERGICHYRQVHNERTVPIIMDGCIAHAQNGYISTSAVQSHVTIVFLDPNFL